MDNECVPMLYSHNAVQFITKTCCFRAALRNTLGIPCFSVFTLALIGDSEEITAYSWRHWGKKYLVMKFRHYRI